MRCPLGIGAVLVEHGKAHALADAEGAGHQWMFRGFLAPDLLVSIGQTLTAIFDGIGETGQPRCRGCLLESHTLAMGQLVTRVVGLCD